MQLPIVGWRAHGDLLFTNWLNYCVYQETPYDLPAIRRVRQWAARYHGQWQDGHQPTRR